MAQTEKTYTREKCGWCSGKGVWNIAPGQPTACVVCFGAGKVSVAQPLNYCRQCRGQGRKNPTSPCLTCAGTGWEGVSGQ